MREMYKGDSYIPYSKYIEVISGKSGNAYVITINGCSCKGYEIRNTCRHIQGAKELGLFDDLMESISQSQESQKVFDNFCRVCGFEFEEKDNFCGNCGEKRKYREK